jgi:hypothetical protein
MDIKLSLYINTLIKITVVSTGMGYSDYILCSLSFVPNRRSVGECCGLSCVSIATICTVTEVWFYPFKAKSSIRMKCHPSLKYFHYNQQFTHTFSNKTWQRTFLASYIFKNRALWENILVFSCSLSQHGMCWEWSILMQEVQRKHTHMNKKKSHTAHLKLTNPFQPAWEFSHQNYQ